uniref:Uncharacterized protein n=1 Tax=Meloidogyne hapla TaxID=6305 RepID=A0A1I8C1P0_MELHA
MVYSKNVKILESSDDFPKEDILSTSWPYPTFPPVYGRKNKNKIEIERIPKTTFLPTTLTSKTELTTMIPFIIEQSTTLMPYLPKKEEIKEMDYVEELSGAGINWNYSEDKELNKVNETLSSTTNKLRRELNNSIINRNYHQHRRKRFKVKRGHLL